MNLIETTRGLLPEAELVRTYGYEERPDIFVLWIEWRLGEELVRREMYPLHKETTNPVYTTKGMLDTALLRREVELTDNPDDYLLAVYWYLDGELVRDDKNLVLKRPTVVGTGAVASWDNQ